MILRPVIVEPVNATLSTPGWAESAAPPMWPRDGTQLSTPGGNLPRFQRIVTALEVVLMPTLPRLRVRRVSEMIFSACSLIGSVRLTNAVKGVSSEGFMTIVQPVARAGPVFHAL